MASIAKWHNPASGYPLRMIALDYTKDRDALVVRPAKEGDENNNMGGIFNPETELGDLWLTLKGSEMNVVSSNLVLYGSEIDEETGLAKRIEAGIPNARKPEFSYAYTAKQIEAFPVPKNLFLGAQLKMHGAPLFMVSALPYKAKQRATRTGAPKPAIVRVSAAPVKPAGIKRERQA